MANVPISDSLAEKLKAIARRQNRALAAILAALVEPLEAGLADTTMAPQAHGRAAQPIRPGVYVTARVYWMSVGEVG